MKFEKWTALSNGALLEGRYRNQGRMRAGDYINSDPFLLEELPTGGPCTAGFGAVDKKPRSNGGVIERLFLLTAGHCAVKLDEEVWRAPYDEKYKHLKYDDVEVGRIRRSAFQWVEVGGVRTDGAAIRIMQGGIVPLAKWGWDGHALPTKPGPVKGDSGAPVWNLRTGASIGLVSAGRPEDSFEETLVAPLLHPPNMPVNRVPGILHHQGMTPLQLMLGG